MVADPSPSFVALQTALAGRYALERELGRGGMGVVYLARDLALDRPVAIKLLPPRLAGVPALREQFLREARTAARLSHPNIVPVHSVEEHGEFVLFVMGYVEGETLAQRIARDEPLPTDEAARIFQEVAWALAYAHRHGVVHRDVKPANILLERGSGRALVSDFGIAQVGPPALAADAAEPAGTARYMSPEQLAGGPLDGRSDLYSLGVTALVALQSHLPPQLLPIVQRCIAPDPGERYPDGEALADALGAVRGQARPVPLAVARFVDLYKTFGTEISSYASIILILSAETLLLRGFTQSVFLGVVPAALFLAIGLGGLRFRQLLLLARRLLGEGYSQSDVRQALERSEESGITPSSPGFLRSAPPRVRSLGAAAFAGLWIVAWRWWDKAELGVMLGGLIFGILTIAPLVALRNLVARMFRPGKRAGWWSRLWWKTLEWKLFKVAGLGGRKVIAASEPTEVALGAGARELFQQLPAELRSRFAEVPRVVERLESQAGRLRGGGEPGGERLASTLAALEQLRLDLLGLRAGGGAEGELTGDLEAARAVSERIEALLEGSRQLETNPQ